MVAQSNREDRAAPKSPGVGAVSSRKQRRGLLQKLANNPHRLQVLVARACGASNREAAEIAGIDERTARDYEDEEFFWALARIQDKQRSRANSTLTTAGHALVRKAIRIALGYDKATNPQVGTLKHLLDKLDLGERTDTIQKHLHLHGQTTEPVNVLDDMFNPYADAVKDGRITSIRQLRSSESELAPHSPAGSDDAGGSRAPAGPEELRSVLPPYSGDGGRGINGASEAPSSVDEQGAGDDRPEEVG